MCVCVCACVCVRACVCARAYHQVHRETRVSHDGENLPDEHRGPLCVCVCVPVCVLVEQMKRWGEIGAGDRVRWGGGKGATRSRSFCTRCRPQGSCCVCVCVCACLYVCCVCVPMYVCMHVRDPDLWNCSTTKYTNSNRAWPRLESVPFWAMMLQLCVRALVCMCVCVCACVWVWVCPSPAEQQHRHGVHGHCVHGPGGKEPRHLA